ncbi:MAG: xanthine dehydrogenase family protein molybdopterin-binding subunit [Gemmatimonadota bacterium]
MPVSRRGFLLGATAAGGLLALGAGGWLLRKPGLPGPGDYPVLYDPTVFLSIDPDGTVTLRCKHLEMGQGISTGLATLVAEEMGADWSRFEVELAPADTAAFHNTYLGRQGTFASTGLANSWTQMRRVGAGARVMLVGAAAVRWGVARDEIRISDGVVFHEVSGRQAGFGELAAEAMAQPVPDPESLELKPATAWTKIGHSLPRLDAARKVAGTATFALDVRRPQMVRAVVARPPKFGATLESFRGAAALDVPGVLEVLAVPSGVAVLAEDTWAALRGREALRIEWNEATAETRSTDAIFADYRAQARRPGVVALDRGEAAEALSAAAQVLEYEYTFPYLAHAPMEPLTCVMERTDDGVSVWAGCQLQTLEQWTVAEVLGLEPDEVRIHTVFAGASFGRRANPRTDWIPELAHIVRESGLGRPVQLVWSREDDVRGGCYRPMSLHRGRIGLDSRGDVAGWEHRGVCASLVLGTPWSYPEARAGVDRASVGAITETTYTVPDLFVDVHAPTSPVPVGFWRSVGDSHGIFMIETLMDELAERAGRDPLEFRLAQLGGDARARATLERAAREAGWGDPVPEGWARGLASSFDDTVNRRTYVAMVVDVSSDQGRLRVERVVAAVDCGVVVNPNVVSAQIEGSVSFALSTVLRNEITLADGAVVQSNFHDFEPTRLREMPPVEVHFIASDAHPAGIGEAGVAPVAPAVTNAVAALTGRRFRSLPLPLDEVGLRP